MKAALGDRIVVVSARLGQAAREGRIVELRQEDGSPPYVVAWSDTGQRGLYFPGTDSHIEHDGGGPDAPPAGRSTEPPHVKTWGVTIHVYEQGSDTSAHVVLHAEAEPSLQARGYAHRAEGDADAPEIGDELAVARALRKLAERLEQAADEDITAITGVTDPVDLFRV
jgi:hypothetical protein